MGEEAAMGIVAVGAGQQPFIHAVMVGHGETGSNIEVTGVAELRFGGLQQRRLQAGRVDGMTVHATHVVLEVCGAEKVCVLLSVFVAGKAALGRSLAGEAAETDDLFRVRGFGMGLAWTMTSFASLPLRPLMLGQRRLPVRPLAVTSRRLLVAGLAGVRADVL